MIKKIGLFVLLISITACATVKEKTSGFQGVTDTLKLQVKMVMDQLYLEKMDTIVKNQLISF